MSAAVVISPRAWSAATCFSPRPSMSIAPRETKCLSSCHWRPGQTGFGHFVKTPSAGLTVAVAQTGHSAGGSGGGERSGRPTAPGAGERTCGITSPARNTITSSPGRTSLRRRSSSLWSVASFTVTPPTATGSSSANGWRSPYLPTFQWTARSVVFAVVGGNFHATAHRGSRPTAPSRRWSSTSETLITTPSISKSKRPRRCSHDRHWAITSSSPWSSRTSGLTGNPASASHARASHCVFRRSPSVTPIAYASIESGRSAASAGSSWRIVPAAEFRGFMKVCCPAAARRSLRAAKSGSDM